MERVTDCMRRDSPNFAKDKYFNGHSHSRSVQENFNLITSFIQEAVDKYILLRQVDL